MDVDWDSEADQWAAETLEWATAPQWTVTEAADWLDQHGGTVDSNHPTVIRTLRLLADAGVLRHE